MKQLLTAATISLIVLSGCQVKPESPPQPTIPYTKVGGTNQPQTNQSANTNNQPSDMTTNQPPATTVEKPTFSKATITTSVGAFTVEFYGSDAPKTVNNFIKLAQSGFYNGTKFHRVIKDFMIQGGDPLSKDDSLKNRWGTGGPGYQFADEFNSHKLVRGSLAMANSGPDTNGSQFFIVTKDATPWLDGKHTNFGQVIDGMDVIDKIEAAATDGNDQPIKAITIEKIDLK